MPEPNDRRQPKNPRRSSDLNNKERLEILDLVDRLRMQARTRVAANRTMRVEPLDPARTVEWQAADQLERLIGKMY